MENRFGLFDLQFPPIWKLDLALLAYDSPTVSNKRTVSRKTVDPRNCDGELLAKQCSKSQHGEHAYQEASCIPCQNDECQNDEAHTDRRGEG